MLNTIESLALVVDYVSRDNLETLTELLDQIPVKNKTVYIKDDNRLESKLADWEYASWANIKNESLFKLKEKLYIKKSSAEKSFTDQEIESIFSSVNNIKYDLIIVASSSESSLENNFLLNANYAEIYFTNKAFTRDFFDINEVMFAIDFFNTTQRNFGS